MKDWLQSKSPGILQGTIAIIAMTALCTVLAPCNASATLQGSAGNTIIRNTVTVNYNDAAGVAQTAATSTVQISVNTVLIAPSVLTFSPASGTTDGTGAQLTYGVMIRTNANGPGIASFSTSDGSFSNLTAGTVPSVPGNILLGSTLIDPSETKIGALQTIANSSTITFAVPNDGGAPTDSEPSGGSTGDGIINGLRNGDTVYIYDGTTHFGPFTVGTVTDPAPGSGNTATPGSIVLTNNTGAPISFTPAYGWMIVEAKSVDVEVTQGVITDPTQTASWVTTVIATMGSLSSSDSVTTSALAGRLSVVKEISTDGGSTFSASPSAVNPGATLTYRITVTNSGTGNATSVILTDPQPTYTTYVPNSARQATEAVATYGAAGALTDGVNSNDDGYDFTAGVATYNVGDITSGANVKLFFQVTVDN